ncbi:uncharacterized protein LOC123306668 [Coccinella septempunctata]|uniref:uncharacterized protein LOC123306668 n=1 Tax=Coccinella septempunctata TaxID=41139 RepID=UPI001D0748B4|nr:uncharacterized protein LOC123306668 [Coccinella septempunctata]
MYNGTTSQIKVGNKLSEKFAVNKGLRQGCCVSPTLFKIYIAKALNQWKRKCKGMGIDLGEMCLYTLQFADDQVIIANDKDDIESENYKKGYQRWGLEISIQKTKYLPIGTNLSNVQLENDEAIEACDEYSYLGVIFDTTGKEDKEIKKRITRKTIGCLNGIFWSQQIGKQRKYNIYETIIKSGLLYGAETWRITERNRRKLEAVEMDVFRRSLGISRGDRVRNEEVKLRMGVEGSLTTEIERNQLIWYGHVQRMPNTRLPKRVMEWIPMGRRKRGRPRKTWKEGVSRAMSERSLTEDQCSDRRTWKLGIGQRRKTF